MWYQAESGEDSPAGRRFRQEDCNEKCGGKARKSISTMGDA